MSNSLLYSGFENINHKLEPVLNKMHDNGIKFDTKTLKSLSAELAGLISKKEKEAYQMVGHEFNLNSSKQVETLLYDELKLPKTKRNKTGYSTDEPTLKNIVKDHPIIHIILSYRELYKVNSTYVSSLPRHVAADGRIHSTFQSDKTATGRLTSSDPNLQNIPIRTEWGTKIRKAFIPEKDYLFLAADYSQFEFHILAHMTGDVRLINSFERGIDIHSATAGEIFHKDPMKVTDNERRAAKTVNFGILYGMSPHGLSEELGISYDQASDYIRDYFTAYGTVKFYRENLLKEAREKGYVETLGGFRREIPELRSENAFVRAGGERMAINFPIQGTAAEIIKVAMINFYQIMNQEKMASRILLQIHDELLLEVPEAETERVKPIVKQEMESVVKLKVPLRVDVKSGISWGELS